jgi:hypothetical protein
MYLPWCIDSITVRRVLARATTVGAVGERSTFDLLLKPPVARRIPRTISLSLLLVAILAVDAFLLIKRQRYREETARLRDGMTALERNRADAIVAAEADRSELMLQLMRRQSLGDDALHLAVSSESSFVALDRGAVRLRTMSAQFGDAKRVGVPPDTLRISVPLGLRRVDRRLAATDSYELPAWVWHDRGLQPPAARALVGALGADAIVASDGTLFYALPKDGPLADSTYVMPGTIRLPARDLAAIRENITPGMKIYFY